MEQIVSMVASAAVFLVVILRLNTLHAARDHITVWRAMEVVGLAILLAGCAGVIGEWFLENADFHAETIVMSGMALAGVGMSRGELRAFVARVWDGSERRRPQVRGDVFDLDFDDQRSA